MCLCVQLVCSLGLVLFHALEYGLRPDEEHVLSRPFEMLLDRMTSADPEASSDAELSSDDDSGEEDCHDEGIEKDSGEDDPGGGDGGAGKSPHRAGLTLAKVLEVRSLAPHLRRAPFFAGKFFSHAVNGHAEALLAETVSWELLCSVPRVTCARGQTDAHDLTTSPLTASRARLRGPLSRARFRSRLRLQRD